MQQPEQMPVPAMADDWSQLREAMEVLSAPRTWLNPNWDEEAVSVVVQYVPKLLDRYAELWEMTMAMMSAWEKLNASKNDLYVPDAADMVGLAKDGEL
jgi:hypothetical protein